MCARTTTSAQWLKVTTTPQLQMKLTAGTPAVTSADRAMIADIGPGTRMIQEPTNVSPSLLTMILNLITMLFLETKIAKVINPNIIEYNISNGQL